MLDGYGKENPATIKKLPVQLDVPELLVSMAYNGSGTNHDKATADLMMIAFYYLLRVGEYIRNPIFVNRKHYCYNAVFNY